MLRVSSRAAQTARDLTAAVDSHKQLANTFGRSICVERESETCVITPATVRSLGALRQPRDDRGDALISRKSAGRYLEP